jgi:hypothetical protein
MVASWPDVISCFFAVSQFLVVLPYKKRPLPLHHPHPRLRQLLFFLRRREGGNSDIQSDLDVIRCLRLGCVKLLGQLVFLTCDLVYVLLLPSWQFKEKSSQSVQSGAHDTYDNLATPRSIQIQRSRRMPDMSICPLIEKASRVKLAALTHSPNMSALFTD